MSGAKFEWPHEVSAGDVLSTLWSVNLRVTKHFLYQSRFSVNGRCYEIFFDNQPILRVKVREDYEKVFSIDKDAISVPVYITSAIFYTACDDMWEAYRKFSGDIEKVFETESEG